MGTLDSPADVPYRTPRRTLPLLEDLKVAAPCDVSWNAMRGNGRVRDCPSCEKQVFNIAGMTRSEAELLLVQRAEGVCARFFRRTDGTIMTADCPVGVRLRHRMQVTMALVTAALAGALVFLGLMKQTSRTCVGSATMGFVGSSVRHD